MVVICSMPPLMATERFPEDAALDLLSVTCATKLDAPAAVGVPEMAPAVLSERPAGSEPDLTLQL
jgi:hypothetical protein